MVKDLMFQMAAGHPFILAGDFNFKPNEIPYRVITEKSYLNHVRLPNSNQYEVSYRPDGEQILKSAYCEKNGTEPNYTNFASTSQTPNFCATLDYIFFAGNLHVNKVLDLPDHPTGESYPDETHPSDHLMIAASFQLFFIMVFSYGFGFLIFMLTIKSGSSLICYQCDELVVTATNFTTPPGCVKVDVNKTYCTIGVLFKDDGKGCVTINSETYHQAYGYNEDFVLLGLIIKSSGSYENRWL
ncbi:unnamed protein product [Rotaria sp. Silwood2]|nr:unnamed protein product [Rotaria sp. Silwood2]